MTYAASLLVAVQQKMLASSNDLQDHHLERWRYQSVKLGYRTIVIVNDGRISGGGLDPATWRRHVIVNMTIDVGPTQRRKGDELTKHAAQHSTE